MTIMDITIRPARPEDIPRLCDLLADLFSLEADFEPDREKQARGLGALIADSSASSIVLVAVMEKKVVGMVSVQTLISTAEGGRVALLEDVIVDRSYRRRGVGAMLLDGATAWSREQGLKRLQLLADNGNQPALKFYKNLRWNPTSLICLRKMMVS
jgi:ribosomal protein S18 acetylase RimI-like enzyme